MSAWAVEYTAGFASIVASIAAIMSSSPAASGVALALAMLSREAGGVAARAVRRGACGRRKCRYDRRAPCPVCYPDLTASDRQPCLRTERCDGRGVCTYCGGKRT